MRLLAISLFLFGFMSASGTGIYDGKGSNSKALGGSTLSLSDPWACFNNQANLALIDKFQLGLGGGKIFNVDRLYELQIAAVLPIKNTGTLGFSFDQIVLDGLYSERRYALSLARKFSEKIAVGMQMGGIQFSMGDEQTTWAMQMALGLSFFASEVLQLSFHIDNPLGLKISDQSDERLETRSRLGGSYELAKNLVFYAEGSLSDQQKSKLHLGLSYEINDRYRLLFGMENPDMSTSLGLNIKLKQITIQFALSYHQYLGSTPQSGLFYEAR